MGDPVVTVFLCRVFASSANYANFFLFVIQVILRWLLQRNITIIPKSVTASRIKENIDILDFTLSDEEMEAVSSLNKNVRLICPMVEKDG